MTIITTSIKFLKKKKKNLSYRVVHIPHFNTIKETKIDIFPSKSMNGVFLDKKRICDTHGIR